MEDIIKVVKSLEDSGLLLKRVTETVQNEVKEEKGGFLSMLLGTLGASLLVNLLRGKGINRAGKGIGKAINRAGEGVLRVGYDSRSCLMPPHPLTNFDIQKYYGVYSRDNLTEIKDGAYIINLDEYSDVGTH